MDKTPPICQAIGLTPIACTLDCPVRTLRSLHLDLSAAVRSMSEWPEQEMRVLDNKLSRRFKKERAQVQKAFAASSSAWGNQLQARWVFTKAVDVSTILRLCTGLQVANSLVKSTAAGYQNLSSSTGQAKAGARSDSLYKAHAQFALSRLRLADKIERLEACLRTLSEGYPGVAASHCAATEAFSACTDARDALMALQSAQEKSTPQGARS